LTLAILFFLLGILLVVLEVFFPSFGVLSLSAAASFLAGVVFAFREGPGVGIAFLVVCMIGIPITLRFAFRALPNTPIGRRFIKKNPTAGGATADAPAGKPRPGTTGTTTSELRPSGTMDVDGDRYDVVTGGEFVERGRSVRVVEIRGNRIIVEPVTAGESEPKDVKKKKKPRWA